VAVNLVIEKADLVFPDTLRETVFPIVGGFGSTSTEVTVPYSPPQSSKSTGVLRSYILSTSSISL